MSDKNELKITQAIELDLSIPFCRAQNYHSKNKKNNGCGRGDHAIKANCFDNN